MNEHPITNYIAEARKLGVSSDQIIKSLTEAGWRAHEILEIVLEHDTLPSAPSAPSVPTPGVVATKVDDENIISVDGVSKLYGKFKALDNISLKVRRGSVTALLGPNGAGKTTLVRTLTTLLPPSSGKAIVAGFDVVNDAQALRSVIGLAGQNAAVDEVLSGRENLEMVGRLYHMSSKQAKARAVELLKQFELEDAADRGVKTYSGGMRRRLDLAASLVVQPKVLFLDEPTTGLDPVGRFTLWQIIRDLVETGTTVLLTTQYLEEADQLAHYIYVVDHGKIIAQGTADELKLQVGGDVLELHTANHKDAERAAGIVKGFGEDAPHFDAQTGIVTLPVSGGAAILPDVVRLLDSSGIKIADIILRRPSLDDVFMKLTGHEAK